MSKVLVAGIVIAVAAASLAVADYALVERPRMVALEPTDPSPEPTSSSSSSVASSAEGSAMSVSSSSRGVVKKGISTRKMQAVNVEDVFARLQLVPQETNEASFLSFAVPDQQSVVTRVLLRNNDRAFLFSWVESDDVKDIFAGLKQALQEQFSGKVTDLIDETRTSQGGPPVDVLSFRDPALSDETILFLRVRNRLYELHIAENGADVRDAVVEALSK